MAEEESNVTGVKQAISHLRAIWGTVNPDLAIICGSGWGGLSEIFNDTKYISYGDIPGYSSTTVEGHEGVLRLCEINQKQILLFQGRRHFYEGAGWTPVCFPVLLAHELGVQTLLLTNAAGGINASFQVGDLMIMEDHINFMGSNPLIGPVPHPKIPRFPDQTEIYNLGLRKLLKKVAEQKGIATQAGVYLALSGPAFETPAEIKALGTLGADAVGMSTVPEAMLGHALGIKVLGLTCISNLASGISKEKLSHDDVKDASLLALPKMKTLISSFLDTIFQ